MNCIVSIKKFGWAYLLSTHYLLAIKHYSTQRPILPSTHHSFLSNIPTDVCSILYLLSPCYQTLQQRCVHLFTMEDMFHPVPTFFLGLLHRKRLVSQWVHGVQNCLPSQRLCWLTLLLHLLSTHMGHGISLPLGKIHSGTMKFKPNSPAAPYPTHRPTSAFCHTCCQQTNQPQLSAPFATSKAA